MAAFGTSFTFEGGIFVESNQFVNIVYHAMHHSYSHENGCPSLGLVLNVCLCGR